MAVAAQKKNEDNKAKERYKLYYADTPEKKISPKGGKKSPKGSPKQSPKQSPKHTQKQSPPTKEKEESRKVKTRPTTKKV